MTTGIGKKEHMVTELPNGYKVSTLKTGKIWETMVFDSFGDEAYCHTELYKNEAKNHHNMAVYKYIAA